MAIQVFQKERNVKLMQPIFSVVDPSKADQLLRQYRGILFPEERWDDLKYMHKATEMFKKFRGKTINIMPAG